MNIEERTTTVTFPQQPNGYPAQPQQYAQPAPQGFPQFPGAQPPQQFPGVPADQGLPQFPQQPAPQDVQTGSVDNFLSGGGKSISFGNAANGFKRLNRPFGGKVISAKTAPVTNMNTKQIERWPDGRVREQLVVTLDTLAGPYPEREDANDDGKRTLYVKGGMVETFRNAIQQGNGGSTALNPGGMLIGCHTGHKPGKNGGVQYLYSFLWSPDGSVPAGAPAPVAAPPQQPTQAPQYQPPAQPVAAPAQQYAAPQYQPPAQPQYAAPVEVPASVPQDQAADFAAWQAQRAIQSAPQMPGSPPAPAQPQQTAAGYNPFAGQ